MARVIGITGYAQHGKDSLAAMLVELGFTKMAFADALRACVYTLNPWVDGPGGIRRYASALDDEGYEEAKKRPEVRRLLQVMGTEVARDILGESTWVNALDKRWTALGMPDLVISDVRFPNEAEWVKGRGVLVRVTRPGFSNGISTDHPSEAHVSSLPVDFDLVATDMDGLREQFSTLRQMMSL